MTPTGSPQDTLPRFGARAISNDTTEFVLWAPSAKQVVVDLVEQGRSVAMTKDSDGFHRVAIDDVGPGTRYSFRLDNGPRRPDPASRFQPAGVHGPSEVVSPEFPWTDSGWKGPIQDELIIYEMHVGAFTKGGTFRSAIDRLGELVELGVTAVELMPVAASAGRWNWGYDGVAFFAPFDAYGAPKDFRAFVDAAHAIGLSVFLDVVYNHAGPEGNYLGEFGPYFSTKHNTVWGEAPNFDGPKHGDHVRQFFMANAIYWLEEFHLDGLRVDAIHCMADDREPHIAAELSDAIATWRAASGRNVMLIAESNVYDPEMNRARSEGGIGFDAMWCDDFLHSTFAVLRPDEQLCHRPYKAKTDLDHTLAFGYVYEGTLREERKRTTPKEKVDSRGLVYSIQNHDFIGNHPLGKRLHQLTSHDAHRAAAALLLLSPAIPMLFMGEEFACEHPFGFFVDFSDENLRRAVTEGRRREYPQHDWDGGIAPTDPEAFQSAKIGRASKGNQETRDWYRDLIRIRKQCRALHLLSDDHLSVENDLANGLFVLRYDDGTRRLIVAVRLSASDTNTNPISFASDAPLLLDSKRRGGIPEQIDPNHALLFGDVGE